MSLNDHSSSKSGEHRDALRGRAALPGAWHSNGESAASLGLAGGGGDDSEKLTDEQLMEMSRMRLEQKRRMPEEDPGPPADTTPAEEYPIQTLQSRMSMLQDDVTNQERADQREKKERIYSCRFWAVIVGILILTAGVITGIVLGLGNRSGGSSNNSQVAPSSPTPAPTDEIFQQRQSVINALYRSSCTLGTKDESSSQVFMRFRSYIVEADPAMQVSIDTANTTARAALCWLSDFDLYFPSSVVNFTSPSQAPVIVQRFVLGLLYLHFFKASDPDTKFNWLTVLPVCTWGGVYCEKFQEHFLVTEVDLSRSGLTNNLPTELALLPKLEVLTFYQNALTGTIPPLNQVKSMIVNDNKLSGSMDALEKMTNLNIFFGHNNQFQGQFPDIRNLTNLEWFGVSGPLDIVGRFPDLSTLTNLVVLQLGDTALTGPLPNLTTLSNLETFDIDGNQLTGPIAPVTKLSSLQNLFMVGNNFNTTIPSELGMLQSLQKINFRFMPYLTGTIPTELGNLTSLETINMLSTGLSGSVPIEICNLRRDVALIEILADCSRVECECCTCD